MAIGFADLGNVQRIPDRGMSSQVTPSVRKISFGDGYEQRAVSGINNIAEVYNVSFNNRPKAEIDDIIAFFTNKAGVSSFNFTIPDTNSSGSERTIKVVCDSYNTTYNNNDFYSCNGSFRRVYEA